MGLQNASLNFIRILCPQLQSLQPFRGPWEVLGTWCPSKKNNSPLTHTDCVSACLLVRWNFVALVCLFVCLFVWVKPENLYFVPCVWREVITPGNGCRRNQAQSLSFTQDSLAFSTKTARRTLQDHVRAQRTLWCRFNQTRATCINTVAQI